MARAPRHPALTNRCLLLRTFSARRFDPDIYRVILFDQRGSGTDIYFNASRSWIALTTLCLAGKSKPESELEDNNTWALVEDMEKVRRRQDHHNSAHGLMAEFF